MCWARASQHRRSFLVAFAVVALPLVVETFAFGYGPTGALGRNRWDELVTGVLMLACFAAGWGRAPAVERSLRRA